MYGNSPPKVK
uniref:Uncharacterized protein n=1 Tax=Anguilla anguilla TaxID=7936 RepID=A0A0E9VYX4_ANGAN